MYELNDPEINLVCHLRASDNEPAEIITAGSGSRMPMVAPRFQPIYRGVRKVRLHPARPTLHMLIQRRLRADEEQSQ
jgi:hypothetical protein